MIYTVTLNPAIDKTIQLNNLRPGALNIVDKSLTNIGGKGINVSMVLKELGAESTALGLVGGENGRYITGGLTKAQIQHFFLDTGKETRTNIKIMEKDGSLTELNEKGAPVEQSLIDEFVKEVKARITEGDILVLSGSVPVGVPATIYADLINIAHDKGAKVILDADGDLFYYGVEAGPDVIKPNKEEFLRYIKSKKISEYNIMVGVKEFFQKGIGQVIISMGNKGACFFDAKNPEFFYCEVPDVEVCSTVGAGDSMVASWAYSMENKKTFEETIHLAMATSAAAVITHGTMPPSIEKVLELKDTIKLNHQFFQIDYL